MELLFTKNSYSHGRGIEKQIRYMQFRNNSGKQGKSGQSRNWWCRLREQGDISCLAVTNTSEPVRLKIWGKIPAQGIV